jgi:hypothetical protein
VTTIAIADGVVAADSQLTGGNYSVRVQKVVRLPDGSVATGAGRWHAAWAGLQWLASGADGDPPDIRGASIVIVRTDKSIHLAEGCFPAYPILDTTYADGCGADMARLLMSQGASPVEAVAGACELDAVSSPPICSMTVQPVEFEPATWHDVKRKRK